MTDLRPALSELMKRLADGEAEVYFSWPGVGRLRLTHPDRHEQGGAVVVHRGRFAVGDAVLKDGLRFEGVFLDRKPGKPGRHCGHVAPTAIRAVARRAGDQDCEWLRL